MGESLKIGTLQHFFKYFDPSTSRPLAQTITHFRIKELESADYRSAYGQLSDWIYGWTVQDVTEFGDDSVLDHFQTKRPTREIDLRNDRERVEAERILKTYEMLHHMTRRILNKFYVNIDDEIPRVGQGLSTFKNGQVDEKENFDDEQDIEKVWAVKSADDLNKSRELLLDVDDDDEIAEEFLLPKNGMTVRRASFLERKGSTQTEATALENDIENTVADQDQETEGAPEGGDEQDDGSEQSEPPLAKIESNHIINYTPGSFQFLSHSAHSTGNSMDLQNVSQVLLKYPTPRKILIISM